MIKTIEPNMIQLWIFLHTVCDLVEGWMVMSPQDRLDMAIMWQEE